MTPVPCAIHIAIGMGTNWLRFFGFSPDAVSTGHSFALPGIFKIYLIVFNS